MANRARRISRSLPKPSLPPPDTLSFQRDAKLCQSNLDIVSTITRGERKRERDRTSKKGALFISRNEFRGAKKSMDVQWREYPSYLFPFPLSLSPLVRPSYPFISRVLLLCAFLHLCRRARWMVAICFSLREIATRYFSRARQTTLTIGHHRP